MKTLCRISLYILSACCAFATRGSTPVSQRIVSDTTWTAVGSPYILDGPVQVQSGITLTLEPGVVVKGLTPAERTSSSSSRLTVNGTLRAVGTAAAPIVITSYRDDNYGGDSNGDGSATAPQPGDWAGLVFQGSSSGNDLEYVRVRYGGDDIYYSAPNGAGVWIETSGLVMRQCVINQSKTAGIYLNSPSSTISGNTISQNRVAIYLLGTGAQAPLSQNTIQDNTRNGIVVASGQVQAAATWNTDAPYHLDGPLQVASGLTLTLEPGVVVKGMTATERTSYSSSQLTVNGTLRAVGTAAAPIVFTSYRDDNYGGDSNGDGSATAPQPGDWAGLVFQGSSSGNDLEYVRVRYGGDDIYYSAPNGANVWVGTSGLVMHQCTISHSEMAGIYVESASPTISGNTISGNRTYGLFNGTLRTIVHAEEN